jgi:hypothetical protein
MSSTKLSNKSTASAIKGAKAVAQVSTASKVKPNKPAVVQPNNYYTQPCFRVVEGKVCTVPFCTYAHSIDRLKVPECRFGMKCVVRTCEFKHPDETKNEYITRVEWDTGLPQTEDEAYNPEIFKEEDVKASKSKVENWKAKSATATTVKDVVADLKSEIDRIVPKAVLELTDLAEDNEPESEVDFVILDKSDKVKKQISYVIQDLAGKLDELIEGENHTDDYSKFRLVDGVLHIDIKGMPEGTELISKVVFSLSKGK